MSLTAMWTHGNSATVESPENLKLIRHIGWGTELFFVPGKSSWIHIPIPTPVIMNNTRAKLIKAFVLFSIKGGDGDIRNVHIFDGPNRIHEVNGLALDGAHATGIDAQNTFILPEPHTVLWGIGVTVFFQAAIGFDTNIPPPLLWISTVGGDFEI